MELQLSRDGLLFWFGLYLLVLELLQTVQNRDELKVHDQVR